MEHYFIIKVLRRGKVIVERKTNSLQMRSYPFCKVGVKKFTEYYYEFLSISGDNIKLEDDVMLQQVALIEGTYDETGGLNYKERKNQWKKIGKVKCIKKGLIITYFKKKDNF